MEDCIEEGDDGASERSSQEENSPVLEKGEGHSPVAARASPLAVEGGSGPPQLRTSALQRDSSGRSREEDGTMLFELDEEAGACGRWFCLHMRL